MYYLAQATDHQTHPVGIKTEENLQVVFVDTPGIHTNQERAINRVMNRSAASVIADVDLVIFVVDRFEWSEADEYVAKYISNYDVPVIVAVYMVVTAVVVISGSLSRHDAFLFMYDGSDILMQGQACCQPEIRDRSGSIE